jgi:uncharacterized protein (TIGR02444 family)
MSSATYKPGLWDWARRAYATPGVEARCLALQDRNGQSVCLLLWADWASISGRAPTPKALADAVGLARTWESEVIGPLRAARRGLKSAPGLAADARTALRAQVQAAELDAERGLLTALEPLADAGGDKSLHPVAAMGAACRAWGKPAPAQALVALAAALPRS